MKREKLESWKESSAMKKSEKTERITAWILLLLLAATLLPVMYLGRYNHPTGDDYYYGAETKAVWDETGSVLETAAEAARGVACQYKEWQGTYSAMFLMYLPPNIFGEWAYRLVTPVMLILLVLGIFYLMKPVVCTFLEGTFGLWVIVSSLLSLLCVQTVPSQGEAFFWYNGSMYYTGYFALTLFFFGLILRYVKEQKSRFVSALAILALFLAGGNYVSLLPTLIIVLLLSVFLAWRHSPGAKGMMGVSILLFSGFLINILAPGNQVRKDGMWSIPAWKAILKSLFQGVRYLCSWTGIWVVLALAVITPFLWKNFAKTGFRFRYPVPVIGLAYGLFCSMSCPTFYTMNSTGPARVVAVVYYGYLVFSFFGYGYLLGYVYRTVQKRRENGKLRGMVSNRSAARTFAAAFCCFLIAVQFISGAAGVSTSGKAIKILLDGEAEAYEREYQDRMRVLEDAEVRDVVFLPYENQPDMLYVGDFSADALDPTNRKTAQYFYKDSIRVEY